MAETPKASAPSTPRPTIITLGDRNGRSFTCEIIDIFDFEDQQYCVLFRIPDDPHEDKTVVLMRLILHEDHSVFEELEADEFERVKAHVTALARASRGPLQ